MKILCCSDLHCNVYISKKLSEICSKEKIEIVIIAGDVFNFGEFKDVFTPFFEKGVKKIIFIPGNHDNLEILKRFIKEKGYSKKIIILEGKHHKIKNYIFLGFSANKVLAIGSNAKKYSEKECEEILKKAFKKIEKYLKNKNNKLITISHHHLEGKIEQLSGFSGCKVWPKFIEKYNPIIHLHGHIHECEGIEYKIKNTKIINLGRKEKIIDLKDLK